MDSKVLNKALSMFYRGSNLSKGAGLGLYSINKVAEYLNGVITLESTENEGTIACIVVPIEDSESNKA
jgi:signal transduction histidine kinase